MAKEQKKQRFSEEPTDAAWPWATWNPFVGCRRVSPACAHCYMCRDQEKYGYDPTQARRTGDKTFYAPLS